MTVPLVIVPAHPTRQPAAVGRVPGVDQYIAVDPAHFCAPAHPALHLLEEDHGYVTCSRQQLDHLIGMKGPHQQGTQAVCL